jgi:hypothetical protein
MNDDSEPASVIPSRGSGRPALPCNRGGVHVDRLVLLADVRVDADRAEQRLHAEGARLVRDDRHDQLADLLVAQQLRQQPHEHHRGRRLAALVPL